MIHGVKSNGYVKFMDAAGKSHEGETRQCVHCQKIWTYRPGSGVTRGWCVHCNGFVCAEAPCFLQQQRWVDEWLQRTSQVRHCIPFEEWNSRRIEKLAHKFPLEPGFTVSPSGLIVPEAHHGG